MDVSNTFLLALLLIVSLLGLWRRLKKPYSVAYLPPGPWKLPLLGNLHQLFGTIPYRAMREMAKTYGPLMHLQMGEVSYAVVSSAEVAKEVMNTHDLVFASRPHVMYSRIISYDSKSIAFAPYGEYWRQLRKICTLELLSAKRVKSFAYIREEETLNLMRWIATNSGESINLTEKIYSLTSSIISRAAFGQKNKEQEKLINVIKQVIKLTGYFNIVDIYPSIKVFNWVSSLKRTFQKMFAESDQILEKIVKDHMMATKENFGDAQKSKDLVDVLLKYNSGNEDFHLTNDNIKAVLWGIYVGGSETSASAVNWALSEMMKNPNVLKRAQEEVRQAFGSKCYIDETKFDELKYVASVVKETLRLHPPLPLLVPRQNSQQVEINGYVIPAKTKVLVNAWAINRDPRYWEEAESFMPERFLDSSIDYKGTHFQYIPFGAGRRICPGITFAWGSMMMPLVQLLHYFDWELPNGMKPEEVDIEEQRGGRRKQDLYLIPSTRNSPPLH